MSTALTAWIGQGAVGGHEMLEERISVSLAAYFAICVLIALGLVLRPPNVGATTIMNHLRVWGTTTPWAGLYNEICDMYDRRPLYLVMRHRRVLGPSRPLLPSIPWLLNGRRTTYPFSTTDD